MSKTKNIKLYSLYRIFSYDMFFYNVIYYFFYINVKHLNISEILFLEALYPIYHIIMQIPCTTVAQKLGAKYSIVLGNALWILAFIFYMIAPGMLIIAVADITLAMGNILKQINEPAILIHALKEENMEDRFNQLEGEGVGRFYYIETIASILAGFLFAINPYIPFTLGAIMSTVSLLISCQFKNVNVHIEQEYNSLKEYIAGLKDSIKTVMHKKRLQALILYSSVFIGILTINTSYYKNFLINLGIDTGQFGIIFALLTIIQGIACQRQYVVERKTKNKTLTWIALSFTLIFVIIGLLGMSGLPSVSLISLIVLLLVIQKIIEGTYQISINKYMVNFTNDNTITSTLTAKTLFNNVGRSLVLLFGAFVLDNMNMNYGYIIVGSTGFIIMSLIILFMRHRVGLKPEEYKDDYNKEEIYNGQS